MAAEGKDDGSPPKMTNYINGVAVPPAAGEYIELHNPATNTVLAMLPSSDAADAEAATAAAKAAAKGPWKDYSAAQRADVLDAIANRIAERADELARLESEDSGKTLKMASTVDIPRAVANFKFFAGELRHSESDAHIMPDAINYTLRAPIGVCGLITPWNLPLYLLSWKVAPCLAMGNTIVAKPSELTPRTANVLAEIANEVGLPPGVLNIVHGLGAKVGAAIVEHPDVKMISFTGGTATGKHVARTAAPLFKKLSLELGGKNPTIVFADCDFDKAVAGAVRSAFLNQGQVCLAGSRLFVQRPVYERFVAAFVEAARAMKCGDPMDPATGLGPLSSAMHLEKVKSYVALAKEEGGVVACGGEDPGLPAPLDKGNYITPCVITGLGPDSRCSTEEIFGPVVTVHEFTDEDEVIEYANGVRYGLAGSLWTQDLTRAHRVAARVETGILWVNCWLHRDLRTPFGGVKDSGIGREGGKYSLEAYSEAKNVCVYIGK